MALRLPPLWLLIGISAIGPVVMNGVVPANSAVMAEFQVRYGTVQLVLTVFMLASLFGQIVLGVGADRYGRRPIILLSMVMFSISGFLCAAANSMEWLLAGRFVQGFFGSALLILPRTIVRDVFGREKAASMIGYMTMAMMVAPLFGPAVAGWTVDNYSWRWMYVGFGVFGAVFSVLIFFFMHETRSDDSPADVPVTLLAASAKLFRLPAFNAIAAMMSGSVGVYYSFLAGSPYVMMESRGFGASEFGLWFTMVAVGYFTGNLIAGRFSETRGVHKMISFGAIPGLTAVVLFWLFSGLTHPIGLFLPMFCVALSNGISLPNLMSAVMSVDPKLMSSASGLAGALQVALGVVLTYSLGLLLPSSDYWLFVFITVSALLWVAGLLAWHRLPNTDHR